MEKILTISIAAYNMEKYLRETLESLIIENTELLEVLIIDDGSKDKTFEIAKEYEKKYPNTFKAMHKENGGYGSTVNMSIKYATGKYFKLLDGDDLYETANLNQICNELKNIDVDVVYTPNVKYLQKKKVKVVDHRPIEDKKEKFSIEEVIDAAYKNYIGMHFIMYKTKILKENNILLEENCFYTDTEYAIYPLLYAKTIKIFDIPLYIYRLEREGQSVSKEGRLKHYQERIKISYKIATKANELDNISNNLKCYLEKYIARALGMCIYEFLIFLKPTKENFNIIKNYYNKIKEINEKVYRMMVNTKQTTKILERASYFKYRCYYYLYGIKTFIREKIKKVYYFLYVLIYKNKKMKVK